MKINEQKLDVGFEIVAKQKKYRGIDRTLSLNNLLFSRENYNNLLELYLRYEEYMAPIYGTSLTRNILNDLFDFQNKFIYYGVPCELMVYDTRPITDLFGFQMEFLGIDVEINTIEGLLDTEQEKVRELLNSNGLCQSLNEVEQILPILNYDGGIIETFYVYKVLC